MSSSAAVGDRVRDVQNLERLGIPYLGILGNKRGEYRSLLDFTKEVIG